MTYTVSTVKYVVEHHREPKGQGFWMFTKKMADGHYLEVGYFGTYLQAKRLAIKEFSKDTGSSHIIYLLP